MEYRILTKLCTFDNDRSEDDDSYAERLVAEQDKVLEKLGYMNDGIHTYIIRDGSGNYVENTIDDAIQCLALKDGADLVQFNNGNVGFIGYYTGFPISENHFEIICTPQDFERSFGELLTWKMCEERVGYSLDYNNLIDCCIYRDELIAFVNENIAKKQRRTK